MEMFNAFKRNTRFPGPLIKKLLQLIKLGCTMLPLHIFLLLLSCFLPYTNRHTVDDVLPLGEAKQASTS